MSAMDFLSPFEELVLTAMTEAGHGAFDYQICECVRVLSGRNRIPENRILFTLRQLEWDSCIYSWPDLPAFDKHASLAPHAPLAPLRRYRVQFRGQHALEAAVERRGNKSSRDYFHRASRFGIYWDMWRLVRSRRRAERQDGFEDITGRGASI